MERTGRIDRATPLKARGKRRFPKNDCPPFRRWLTTQRCFVTGQRTGGAWWLPYPGGFIDIVVDPAHLPKSKGAGAPDLGGCLPLAHHLHRESHQVGITTWLRKHGLTAEGVTSLAQRYADEWRRKFPALAAKYEARP